MLWGGFGITQGETLGAWLVCHRRRLGVLAEQGRCTVSEGRGGSFASSPVSRGFFSGLASIILY